MSHSYTNPCGITSPPSTEQVVDDTLGPEEELKAAQSEFEAALREFKAAHNSLRAAWGRRLLALKAGDRYPKQRHSVNDVPTVNGSDEIQISQHNASVPVGGSWIVAEVPRETDCGSESCEYSVRHQGINDNVLAARTDAEDVHKRTESQPEATHSASKSVSSPKKPHGPPPSCTCSSKPNLYCDVCLTRYDETAGPPLPMWSSGSSIRSALLAQTERDEYALPSKESVGPFYPARIVPPRAQSASVDDSIIDSDLLRPDNLRLRSLAEVLPSLSMTEAEEADAESLAQVMDYDVLHYKVLNALRADLPPNSPPVSPRSGEFQ